MPNHLNCGPWTLFNWGSDVPASRWEIFTNLQLQAGIPTVTHVHQNRNLHRFFLWAGMGGISISIIIILASIVWIILALNNWERYAKDHAFAIALAALIPSLHALIMGYRQLADYRLQTHFPFKIREIYDTMKKEGHIIHGKIVSVESSGNTQTIHYIFDSLTGPEKINGQYITTSRQVFLPEDVVDVFYLNEYTHILHQRRT